MDNFKLDTFQKEAIDYALSGNSVIVSAPTGAGKTLIAERVIEDCMQKNQGVIYTAPIKALSNQKFRDFSQKYPNQVGILTGDVNINRNAPLLIMTTEIFRNAIMVEPENFAHISWVIFDEIHYLDDIERGTVWEEAIILLPAQMKLLALSATIPNLGEFIGWLKNVHSFPIQAVTENQRPVPLHFLFQCDNQFFDSLESLKSTSLLKNTLQQTSYQERYWHTKPNTLKALLSYLGQIKGYPCVYFSFSRRRCEQLAGEISHLDLLTREEKGEITRIFNDLIEKFSIASSTHINFISPLIQKGIAYHHAGLLPALKEIIERLFTTGLIKLIFTTETFALGINMPAKAVTFDSLSKYYGGYHGYLKTRDFYQMAGRSGRRGIDSEGFVIARVNPSHIDLSTLNAMLYGQYEPIRSQLNSCYATILNLYKTMGDKIYDIYPNSFHFYQSKQWEKKEVRGLLQRKISLLKNMGYIQGSQLTAKGDLAAKVYSFELAIGELFDDGYFNHCDEETLFTLITALVYEPRKGQIGPRFNKRTKRLKRDVASLTRSIHKVERNYRVSPLSKKTFFHLSEICQLWLSGTDFSTLSQKCAIDEGEIVRYFRMSLQVLRQMHSSPVIDQGLKKKLSLCMHRVNRDVIDAQKQMEQEL